MATGRLVRTLPLLALLVVQSVAAQLETTLSRIDELRYAGRLNAAINLASTALETPGMGPDDQVVLLLRLSTMSDRIGLHRNSRPVPASLEFIDRANDLRELASSHSQAAIDHAYAKAYYRAEMAERAFEQAEYYAKAAIEGYSELNDNRGQADAVHALGLINMQRRELEQAQARFDHSLALEQLDPDPRAEMLADFHRHTAFVYYLDDQPEKALPHFEASLKLRRDGGLIDASVFAAASLGSLLVDLERPAEARDALVYARLTAIAIDSPVGEARALVPLGRLGEQSGDIVLARRSYERLRQVAAEVEWPAMMDHAAEALERIGRP